jgi:hypothetical protein
MTKKRKTKSSNQKLLTDYYNYKDENKHENQKIYGFNNNTGHWHCLDCGLDMGCNSRQLCGKYYCVNINY